MAAIIGLSSETVEDLCCQVRSKNEVVGLAIHNAPNQVVISGHGSAVEKIMTESEKKRGAEGCQTSHQRSLPLQPPRPGAEWLRADLNGITFHEFKIPVIPNCDSGLFYNRGNVCELLARQITSPVQWQGTI